MLLERVRAILRLKAGEEISATTSSCIVLPHTAPVDPIELQYWWTGGCRLVSCFRFHKLSLFLLQQLTIVLVMISFTKTITINFFTRYIFALDEH